MDTSIQNAGAKVANTIQKGADKGKEALNTVANKGQQFEADSYYSMAKDKAEDVYAMAKDQAGVALEASEDFVKKYPLYTVLGAAAIGAAAAWLIKPSRR
jgi:ElaB/YqjD/DUF883 family membrane-anchored ribosome-binding protein